MVAAPQLADALGTPDATGVIRLLAVALLTSGFSAVPGAMLQREFRQDHKLFADTAAFVLSTIVVIVLVIAGYGPWALAWSRIVANGTAAIVMTVLTKERFMPGFDRHRAAEILRFSLPLAGASLLVFAVLNVDYIVVGAALGPVELGLYLLAFNLSSWPVTAFSNSIRSVSIAGFAQMQDDRSLSRTEFCAITPTAHDADHPGVCAVGGVCGAPGQFRLRRSLAPDRCSPRRPRGAGAARVALELAYDFLAAIGRSGVIFGINVLWFVALVPALIVGANIDGLRGVAWATSSPCA